MLAQLQQIVQRVNTAGNLHEALAIVVERVKAEMGADVCSVYVRDPAAPQYVLIATDGLNPAVVGKIRMATDEGIVGLVATRQEAINLANAAEHASYRHFPETGEEQFSDSSPCRSSTSARRWACSSSSSARAGCSPRTKSHS